MVLRYLEPWKLFTIGAFILTVLCLRVRNAPRITRDGKPLRNPPNTLPLVGNGIHFLLPRQTLFDWFTDVINSSAYAPLETLSITVPTLPPGVIISSPENLDYVFRNEALFKKGEFFRERSWDLFGEGIINVDGEGWRLQRKAGIAFLSGKRLHALLTQVLPRYLDEAVQFLSGKADAGERDEGEIVDLQEVIHQVTTQVMGRMAYDMEMHVNDDFTKAFEFASGGTAERFQNPLWMVTEWVTPAGWKLRRALGVVRQYGADIVTSAVQSKSRSKGADCVGESGTLINALLDSIKDEKLVADAALNYLSAGRDTVAQALTWTFYLLLRNPLALKTLREDLNTLQHDLNASTLPEILSSAHLTPASLPYAMAIFYEALRLFPPIPFEIKQVVEATTMPDGTCLPKGAIVTWSPWAMGRSKALWGDDVAEFKPERWLEEDKDGDTQVMVKSQGEFPVFNGGSRLCLGKKMAEGVGVAVIGVFGGMFDFERAFEGGRKSVISSLTLPMEGGLPVRVKRRI